MSDLTDAAVKQSEDGVTEPQELGGQSSTSMDTIDDDLVAVDAKDVPPVESTTSESMDGISQESKIQASEENEEQDGPRDGGTAEVQEEKVKGAMSDLTETAVKQSKDGVTEPQELGGQSSTSMDTYDDDLVAVVAKDVTPVESATSESMDGISQESDIQASGENEEQDGPGDGGTPEVQEDKNVNGGKEGRKRAEEEKQREEEKKREEEERRREEEIKRAEEEKQREEEKKREEEQRLREEEMKRAEEERQREEKIKRAEEERQREEEKREEEEKQREEEKKREEEERRREEKMKRAEEEKHREEEKQREEEKKREEEERQREEEKKREEKMKAKEVKTDEDRQREGSAKVEELQMEGEGTDEADQAIGTETILTPAEVSEGTELTRRKVASKDTPSESATDHGESMVHGESKDPAPSSDGSIWKYGSIVILISISVFIVGFIIFTNAPPSVSAPDETAHSDMDDCLRKRSDRLEVLYEEIESLSEKFPSLDQSSLDTIAGASWAHVQDKEELVRPVVLLLVSQPDHVKANDVAEEVANLYSNVYHKSRGDIVRVDGDNFEDETADQVKKDIDAKIKAGLKGCAHVVIIKDLDELQPCSIILFHGYCDNDGAPYKDAVFIFTMTLDDSIPEDTSKLETEKIIQEHLEQHLLQCPEEFPKDKIAAMNSRLANNIVMLN